jgi:hypothetical protein
MRRFLQYWLIFIGLLPAVAALSQHYYYTPNSVQMPAATKRHDTGIGIGWSRNTGATGMELQGYYSPLKRVLVCANYMDIGEKEVLKNTVEGLKYRFYEFGAGVYEPMRRGTASLIVGYGRGNMFNAFQGEEFADMDLERLFIQPSILYNDAFFQGGICFRFSQIKYTRGKVAVAIPASELNAIRAVEEKSPLFLPEIGITGAMRLMPFVLGVNICGIFPRTDELDFVRVNSAIFLNVELGDIFRKKKKTEAK